MKLWAELVRQGILGSQRPHSLSLDDASEPLRHALSDDSAENPELKFLNQAALLGQYRLHGIQQGQPVNNNASVLTLTLTPCAEETLNPCSHATTQHLRLLIGQNNPELMSELLKLMAEHQQHIPFELLPALFEFAQQHKTLQACLTSTVGERGRWLSRLNPDWKPLFSQDDDIERRWREDSPGLRRQTLKALRASDPDRARAMLSEGWSQETAKDRQMFLPALRINPQSADLEFLQSCLNDRSQAVRQEATRQLVLRAEQDTLSAINAIVKTLLAVDQGGRKTRLQVNLPEQFDKTWQRFGIAERKTDDIRRNKPLGKKAVWVSQCLQLLIPSHLAQLLALDLVTLCKAIEASDYADMLFDALDQAALSYHDQDYLEQRLQHLKAEHFADYFPMFSAALSTAQRQHWLSYYLSKQGKQALTDWSTADTLLGSCQPLSAELTRTFITVQLPALLKHQHWGKQEARRVGGYLAISCWPELQPALAELPTNNAAAELISVFRLRYQIHQEFV